MRRDMELVRSILLAVADASVLVDGNALTDELHDLQAIGYHVEMMRDAGLVEATIHKEWGGTYVIVRVGPLTWEGNDFLDAVANDTVWKKVKTRIAQLAGNATFEITKALAVKYLGELLL